MIPYPCLLRLERLCLSCTQIPLHAVNVLASSLVLAPNLMSLWGFGTALSPPMCFSGKCVSQSPVVNSVTDVSNLLYTSDANSGRHFLINTGAEISVFPSGPAQLCGPATGPSLVTANGLTIRTFTLGKHLFTWTFTIADIPRPLIGTDFLHHHTLLVDLTNHHLIDKRNMFSTPLYYTANQPAFLQLGELTSDKFASLLAEFPEITQPNFSLAHPTHDTLHHIPTKGTPSACPCSSASSRQAGLSQSRIQCTRSSQHRSLIQQFLVITTPHGSQAFWRVVSLW